MKKWISIAIVSALLIPTMSCYRLTHEVGEGAQGNTVVSEQKQWYAIFGLVDMNSVDSKTMSEGAENYTVVTEMTPIDWIISIFTSVATINCWTVRVIE